MVMAEHIALSPCFSSGRQEFQIDLNTRKTFHWVMLYDSTLIVGVSMPLRRIPVFCVKSIAATNENIRPHQVSVAILSSQLNPAPMSPGNPI